MAKFCSLFYSWVVFHCVHCIFLSIHVLIDSRLLPYLGIVSNAVLNIGAHVSFELVLLFLSYILRVEFLSHTVVLFLIFWETFMMFFTLAAPIYIPTAVYKSSFFSTSSTAFAICVIYDDSHSESYEAISYCVFDVRFFVLVMSSIFSYACWPSLTNVWEIFEKMFRSSVPYLIALFFFFFNVVLYEPSIYFEYWHLISHIILKYFLPFSKLSFCFVDGFLCCAKA